MMWMMFVAMLSARVIGNVIWHFVQLWMANQEWYRKLCVGVATKTIKKTVDEMEDMEL